MPTASDQESDTRAERVAGDGAGMARRMVDDGGTPRAAEAGGSGPGARGTGAGTPDVDTPEVDLRLAGLVVELMDRTRQTVREVGEEEGLSIPQLDVLRRLRRGPSPMRRLAVQMNCEASNLTGLVDRLEARGLVERLPYPEDRRVKCVALTREGEELGREMWLAVAGRCELNRLSDSRKQTVAAALRDAMRGDEIDLRAGTPDDD